MLAALVGISIRLVALYVFALVLFHIYRKDLTWQKLYTLEINLHSSCLFQLTLINMLSWQCDSIQS